MSKQTRLRVHKEKRGRRVIAYFLVVVAFGCVGWQVNRYYGLLDRGRELLATIQQTLSVKGPARGTIYDRNLKQVAVTMERVSVYVRTREIDSLVGTVETLGAVLAVDKKKLQDQLERGVLRLWVAHDITQEQEEELKRLRLPGVYLQREAKRYYPNEHQAAHLVGYVEDGIGLSGVEFYYDRLLASRKSEQQQAQQPLSNAQDLVLTIDFKIQTVVDQLVEDIHTTENALRVAAYMMEANTGEIIAGSQLPGFNPNTFTHFSQDSLENIFLKPLRIPDKYRLFVRDAALLWSLKNENGVIPPWSVAVGSEDLGSQLRLWELLGMGETTATDFFVANTNSSTPVSRQQGMSEQKWPLGLVPEHTSPLNLLNAFSILLGKGKRTQPFVVKKIIDIETGQEVLIDNGEGLGRTVDPLGVETLPDLGSLFQSQAIKGPANSYFFTDDVLVGTPMADAQQLMVNDLTFVTIPAGNSILNMLVVVQHYNEQPELKGTNKSRSPGLILEEKIERFAVLQQVAKTVADVVEPETAADNNYRGSVTLPTKITPRQNAEDDEALPIAVMPDLVGLSLRKSLRLLQGVHVKINIQGTGRVVSQQPLPGTSLKGVSKCVLTLESLDEKKLEKLPAAIAR